MRIPRQFGRQSLIQNVTSIISQILNYAQKSDPTSNNLMNNFSQVVKQSSNILSKQFCEKEIQIDVPMIFGSPHSNLLDFS